MLVKEVMIKKVIVIGPNETIQEAARIMSEKKIGSLVVTENEKPIGIISDGDILNLVKELKPINKMKVKDVMSKNLITIGPDAEIEDAVKLMIENKIERLPVVFEGNLVGIVTAMDLAVAEPKMIEQLAALMFFAKKGEVAG